MINQCSDLLTMFDGSRFASMSAASAEPHRKLTRAKLVVELIENN